MPESTKDAMILITISYQALQRAKVPSNPNVEADCIVVIIFAAFFIEANLNYIIEFLGKEQEVNKFYNINNPEYQGTLGLNKKLAWFYYSFIESNDEYKENKKELYKKTHGEFLGIEKILKFRDNTSHGNISPLIANIDYAEELRNCAKNIVTKLFNITKQRTEKEIPRIKSYSDAIGRSHYSKLSSSDNQ